MRIFSSTAVPRTAGPTRRAKRRGAVGHWPFLHEVRRPRPVSRRDAGAAIARLAALTNAGLSSGDALASCARSGNTFLLRLHAAVRRGTALSAALRGRGLPFTEAEVAVVHAGERGGSTARALTLLAQRMESESAGKRRIVSALAYPALLLCGAVAALLFLSIVVLPSFTTLYQGSRVELPWTTRTLLAFGQSVQSWGSSALLLALSCGLGFAFLRRASFAFSRLCDRVALQWWPLRSLVRPRASHECCSLLSMLLDAGSEVEEALGLAARAAPNRMVAQGLGDALRSLRHGVPLSRAWATTRLDPSGDALALLEIAEATGGYASAFGRIATLEGAAAEQALTRACGVAEPMAVLAMAVAVGGGVLALYQPMLGSASLLLGGTS